MGHKGFYGSNGVFFLTRCGDCGKENWGPAVASGHCAWCGAGPAGQETPAIVRGEDDGQTKEEE